MKKYVGLKLLLLFMSFQFIVGCINNNDAALVVEQLQSPMDLRPSVDVLMVNEKKRFFAEGGIPPYQYKIKSGGGTIDLLTGDFTAPPTVQMVSLIITDANNKAFTKNIQIVDQIKISSPANNMVATTSMTFTATGGVPPYVFSTLMGGGTIDAATGVFVAPGSAGSAIVKVTDSIGYTDTKLITIIPIIQISPKAGNFPVNSKILLSALGGQPPVSFSVSAGNATVDAINGILSFGSTPGTVTVIATDSLGFTSQINLNSFYSKLVSTGAAPFSCGVNIYGKVQCWGYGYDLGYENAYWGEDSSQLGINLLPKYINNFGGLGIVDITNFGTQGWYWVTRATEPEHACALFTDSSVRCWGLNDHAQLGTGNYLPALVGPGKPLVPLSNLNLAAGVTVIKLATAQQNKFSCALLSDNTVKCWGFNTSYQVSPSGHDEYPISLNLGTNVLVTDIKLGRSHACALFTSKSVKCWGENMSGQLGISQPGSTYGGLGQTGDNLPYLNFGTTVEEIALGQYHSCARLTDGSVKCWGNNQYGQLGLGVTTATFGNTLSFNLSTHPTVDMGINPATNLPYKAQRVYAFGNRTCAHLEDGLLKCWGNNKTEILGIEKGAVSPYDLIGDAPGEVASTNSLVNLGTNVTLLDLNGFYQDGWDVSTTCALLLDQTVNKKKIKCWGKNNYGELGYGMPTTVFNIGDQAGQMGDLLPFVDTGGLEVTKTALGPHYSCALLTDNQVHCWGQTNDSNGLGGPSKGDQPSEFGPLTATVNLGTTTRVVAIKTRRYNSCAIFADGKAKCWGLNDHGQLGLGDKNFRGARKNTMGTNLPFMDLGTNFLVKDIDMEQDHMCALSQNGRIKCWGLGWYGKLGNGSPAEVGSSPGQMGDNLPYVNLGTDSNGNPLLATKVTVGFDYNCALLQNQKVKCWGNNTYGNLGLNSGYDTNNPYIGDVLSEMGNNLRYADLGTNKILDISSGQGHTCAILDDFSLKCWGINYFGQLGYEDKVYRGILLNDMVNLQAVNLGTGVKALSVFAGTVSTCVITTTGKLKCWGSNAYGQLGLESNIDYPSHNYLLAYNIGDNFNEMGDNLPYVNLGSGLSVYFVAPEQYHTCAVLSNGEIKCWGLNGEGALGHNDTKSYGNLPNTMGDFLPQLLF